MAGQIDIDSLPRVLRGDHDIVDHGAQGGTGLGARGGIAQRVFQVADHAAIFVGELGVQCDDGQRFRIGQRLPDRVALAGCLRHRGAKLGKFAAAGRDGIDEPGDATLCLGQLFAEPRVASLCIFRPPRMFGVIFLDEGGHQIGVEQLVGKAAQHTPFKIGVQDRPFVRAGGSAAFAISRAAPSFGAHDRVRRAAAPALCYARQQAPGSSCLIERQAGVVRARGVAGGPKLVADDAKVRHRMHRPFVFGLRLDRYPARARVDHLAGTAHDQLAAIEAVAQDAVAALARARYRVAAPEFPRNRSDTVCVEAAGDIANRLARRMFGENAQDDRGGFGIDFAQTPDRLAFLIIFEQFAIAVGDPCRRKTLRGAALLGAADIVRQLDAHMLVDHALDTAGQQRDLAIGKGEQARASEIDFLADEVAIADAARDAAGRVGQYLVDVAPADAIKHRGHCWALILTKSGAAADRIVGKDLDHGPALAFAALAADGDLVFDRPLILQFA